MPVTNDELRAEIASVAADLNTHEQICLLQNKATNVALDALQENHAEIKTLLSDLNKTAWQAVWGVAAMLIPVIVWMFVQIWPVRGAVVSQEDLAAKTASRYTSEDAARDRAAQQEMNKVLADEIARLKGR